MTRGDCPHCHGFGSVPTIRASGTVLCIDCGGTGLTAESLDVFHQEIEALSRAALARKPKEGQS